MEIYLAIITTLIAALFIFFFFLLWQLRKSEKESKRIDLVMYLQNQMESMRKQVSDSLSETSRTFLEINKSITENISSTRTSVDQKLEATTKAMMDVHKQLGAVDEAVKKIFDVGKDIKGLQEILSAPKLRGGMGELFLEELLSQIMPGAYFSLQYAFKSGEKVDAVIRAGERLVPVDAKFPLENFRKFVSETEPAQQEKYRKEFMKDVRKHIESISAKYILPDEGTYDFALMYIPAENVYYETIIRAEDLEDEKGLFHFSVSRRVIPVSPNSFYAYLQVILLGLRGMKVEERAKEILARVTGLQSHLKKLFEDFDTLGKHINNAHANFDKASKKLEKFSDAMTTLLEPGSSEEKLIESGT